MSEMEEWIDLAYDHALSGNYEKAIEYYEKILEVEKNNIAVLINASTAYHKIGQSTNALKYVNDALKIDPNSFEALCNKATILLVGEHFEEALEIYKKTLSTRPDPAIMHSIATICRNLGHYEKTIEYSEMELKLKPESVMALFNKAYALDMLDRPKESINAVQKILKCSPDNLDALEFISQIYLRSGDHENAIKYNNLAMKMAPNNPAEIHAKGDIHYSMGEFEQALSCYERALEIDSSFTNALASRGNVLAHYGNYKKALECFNVVLQTDSTNMLALHGKSNALSRMGQYHEALDAYNAVLKVKPDYAAAWSEKSFCYVKLGMNDKALECADMALKITPNDEALQKARDVLREKCGG